MDRTVEQKIIDLYTIERKGSSTISKILHLCTSSVLCCLHKNNITIRSNREKSLRYTVNDCYFDVIDTEHKAYWLGLLYADGFVSSSTPSFGISLNIQDIELLQQFKKDLNFSGNINVYNAITTYGETRYGRIMVNSPHIYNNLLKKGVIKQKTLKLTFPSHKIVPNHLVRHFIRGYFDGDGCFTHNNLQKNKQRYTYNIKFCGTKEFLEGIQKFFMTNLTINKKINKAHVNNFQLSIGGNKQVYNIIKTLYHDATLYLSRKYNKMTELLQYGEKMYELY